MTIWFIHRRCILISEFGIKIKNIEASTLLEYQNGVRSHYEHKDALFVNSLFGDYLKEHGMKIAKDGSTKDMICLEFHYGSRSYRNELNHLRQAAASAMYEYKKARIQGDIPTMNKAYHKRKRVSGLVQNACRNKQNYLELTKEELRKYFYNHGAQVSYISYDRNNHPRRTETIHYTMLYRSTGKAKKGSCMFIRDELYPKASHFLHMGIRLPDENPRIVELGAYASLISSSIVGKVKIHPENILILKDIERSFHTNVIRVETDESKHCIAKRMEDYELKNVLFDGQALIDTSIFPSWGNGYILLRHHFCKMAAFHTNIQEFFRDYFGDSYETATVKDMFGREHFAKDIELITTDNAMKWLKFQVSYEDWCEKVRDNDCMFGVVKTAHESKLGTMQKMSYQMVNSLEEDRMEQVVRNSMDYVNQLKQDNQIFLDYLDKNRSFSNDYEVLTALCRQNPDFTRSEYFRERKKAIINAYVLHLKHGELLQNAENLVIVGSPYAMLLYAASGDERSADLDETFSVEDGAIQCYTERFPDQEYLAFFRSPFNARNNLTYLHNVYHELWKKYFHLGRQIIAVQMNGTDFQDRNNGSDQDSDFGYTTNQPEIVAHARRCYRNYPTIVNCIPKDQNTYHNTMDDYAAIDNGLANSQADIGEASNLAQIAQTYACNFDDPKYNDFVCILSVLAQVAIDSAKRRFAVNLTDEIRRIKSELDIQTHRYPEFWSIVKRDFNREQINPALHCPMNYLYHLDTGRFRNDTSTLPMSCFFQKHKLDIDRRTCKKVEDLIHKYSLNLFQYQACDSSSCEKEQDYLLLKNDFADMMDEIQKIRIPDSYLGLFSWLLDRAFCISPGSRRNSRTTITTLHKNRSLLLKVLYTANQDNLLQCFSKRR